MYIKNEFVSKNMFQFMVYFRLKYNMPMKELIDICIEKNHQAITSPKTSIYIYDLESQDNERQWLVIFLNTIQKKNFKDFNEKKTYFSKLSRQSIIFIHSIACE